MEKSIGKQIKNFNKNYFEDLFSGNYLINYTCRNCKNEFKHHQKFYSIDIDLNVVSELSSCFSKNIRNILKEENIENYFCKNCNQMTSLFKETVIETFPHSVLFYVKRYNLNFINNKIKYKKNKSFFKYPLKFTYDNFEYEIKGFIVHENIKNCHYYSLHIPLNL